MSKLWFVYEAVNPSRKEIVVGISGGDGLDSVRRAHSERPPKRMTRWDPEEGVQYRVVESSLPISDALECAARYSESDALELFRVYLSSESLVA